MHPLEPLDRAVELFGFVFYKVNNIAICISHPGERLPVHELLSLDHERGGALFDVSELFVQLPELISQPPDQRVGLKPRELLSAVLNEKVIKPHLSPGFTRWELHRQRAR